MKPETFIIDIDDTIIFSENVCCKECGNPTYRKIKTDNKEIKLINQKYDEGNFIIIFTGRSWLQYETTKKQLKECGVKFHKLIMGKPIGIYIDKDSLKTLKDYK